MRATTRTKKENRPWKFILAAEVEFVALLAVLKLKLNDEKLVPHVAVYIAGRKKSGEGKKVTLSADALSQL